MSLFDDSPRHWMEDLTDEGRRAWLAENEAVARFRFDDTFTRANERYRLDAFGFRSDDPVSEAVDWAIDRFRTGIDLTQVQRAHRNERLFEQMNFWLEQKVSKRAITAVKGRADRKNSERRSSPPRDARAGADSPETKLSDEARRHWARALHALSTRTCNTMVAYWLEAADRLDLASREERPRPDPSASKGLRSRYRSLAVFRWTALLLDEVDPVEPDMTEQACRVAYFRPCPDRRPYRNPDAVVAGQVPDLVSVGTNKVKSAVREGAAYLLERLLDRSETAPADESRAGVPGALAGWVIKKALGPTVLKALSIEGGWAGELRDRLKARRSSP